MRVTDIVMALFIVLGMALFFFQVSEAASAARSTAWKTTSGVIEEVSWRTGSSKPSSSTYDILYRYTVNGKEYHSDREEFGVKVACHSCAADYTEGQHVTVYYDLNHPSEAVLKPGVTKDIQFGLLVGILFMVIGAGTIWHSRAYKKM